MKLKNQSPENHENPFALSFKANFTIKHTCINEVLGLHVHYYTILTSSSKKSGPSSKTVTSSSKKSRPSSKTVTSSSKNSRPS